MHFLHDHAPISLHTDASDFGVGVIVFSNEEDAELDSIISLLFNYGEKH